MRIQKIIPDKTIKIPFKQYQQFWDYEDDYGTYYNQTSFKDAIISSCILSSIIFILGGFIAKKPAITAKTFNKIV